MATPVGSSTSLEYTPTWVVALLCSIIVTISLLMERFLHYLGKLLKHKGQKTLFEALLKLKEELMLLGFISLLLTVFQSLISHICIPASVSTHMLPCKRVDASGPQHEIFQGYTFIQNKRKLLAEGGDSGHCAAQGKVPLLSLQALHQLHIFIFVLAVVHVIFCAITMVLGGAKIRKWRHWEKSIINENSKMQKTINRSSTDIHPHHQFLSERTSGLWRKSNVVNWTMAFFKQFHASVTKSDYTCLRYGFIMKHCRSNMNFNFHKYMMRTLETDFKKVIGISWYLWLFVIIFLLLNVHGWHTYFYLSFLPLVLLLIVGAKLEHIITRLAQDALINPEDDGAPRIKPSDEHFWFNRPYVVLYLIHFILFQNAFELAYFFWILTTYGFDSCIMESIAYIIPRLAVGVLIQVLCSYSTLPLYAIVTQMGEMFKQSIFEEFVQSSLHGWVEGAKRKAKSNRTSSLKGLGWKRNSKVSKGEIQMQKLEPQIFHNDHHAISMEEVTTSIAECSDSMRLP